MIKIDKDIPQNSFIGGYYIDGKICDNLLDYFNTNKIHAHSGCVTDEKGESVVDINYKESLDLEIGFKDKHYPIYDYRMALQECLEQYSKDYDRVAHLARFQITSSYNIQYYKPNAGFKTWHCERASLAHTTRCLVFCTYLNDVENGGTEFLYQNYTTKAEKGLTVLFPSDWTHTHRGQISDNQEKYIITGWYDFIE